MKTFLIALLFASSAAVSAGAETFTGTTTSTTTSSNMFSPPGDKPVLAISLTFTGNTVMASGKTAATKGSCTEWTTPPGSIFQTNLVCNYTDSSGDAAALLAGCDYTNKDMTEADCWGGLQGSAGPHAGKTGTISWHVKLGADGKTGLSNNVGQWND